MRPLIARRAAFGSAFAAALVLTPSCGGGDDGDPGAPAVTLTAAEARWTLAWDREGTQTDSGATSFTTDRGYVVRIDSGFVVSHWVTLGECTQVTWAPWNVRAARAHEGANASTVHLSLVEDLSTGGSVTADAGFTRGPYCYLHWLVAKPEPGASIHAHPEAANTSLSVRGAWTKGERSGSVELATWWSHGALRPVQEALTAPCDGAVEVVVTRRLSTLFDGVELDGAAPGAVAEAALTNLVEGARFRATCGAARPR